MRPEPSSAAEGSAATDQDPLWQALSADIVEGWRAHDIFVAWLLTLPAEVDPSLAATVILAKLETLTPPAARVGEIGKFCALLEETMSWPRPDQAMELKRRNRPRVHRSS